MAMILNVIINEQNFPIQIPEEMLTEAEDFFQKIDNDMDKGWQMSRKWVDNPNSLQRCQIVADKMLTAIENEKNQMVILFAAYILKRIPGINAVDIDTDGDITATELIKPEEI